MKSGNGEVGEPGNCCMRHAVQSVKNWVWSEKKGKWVNNTLRRVRATESKA